ncbi:MAG TPA: serine/threonine-protein kinase, partial [Polyangiaceae bacterium]|nr:serine/threonine-protein kinase [Polyangiaceae bacterium]
MPALSAVDQPSTRTLPAVGASDHPPPTSSLASAPTMFDTGGSGQHASGPRPVSTGAPLELRPFGPYSQVVALDAQGSMGWVARGFNESFGRWELLKFLRPELASEVELIRQFMREGRVLAKLSHPNVVQVFASYSLEGHACLAMEYLEGKSLAELVAEAGGRLSSEQALALMLEATRGLAAAHELGLLHRDIKPDNIFVVEAGLGRTGALKLIDFGLATADRARPETLMNDPNLDSNAVGGTPLFLSPELWKGQTASPRSDLYALGVTFYYALSAAFPTGPLGIRGLMEYAKSDAPAPRLREARPDVMPGLAGLIDRLIAKDPTQRPESAALLLHELVALQEAARPRRLPGTGPFRGLGAYSESERDVLFGRDAEIAEVTERFRSDAGIALVGPAGSGKTSLALAGVVPRIREGVLGGGIRFAVAVVEPSRRPLRALSAALNAALGGDEDELKRAFEESALAALDVVRRRLAGAAGLLLVVDQLEALARECEQAGEARRFAEIIARLAENAAPDIRVLCCLRVEALDDLLGAFDLKQFFARGFVPVQPLAPAALNEAVTQALAVAGFAAGEPELLEKLVREVAAQRHGAWLVGLLLSSLWRDRDEAGKRLRPAELQAQGGFTALLVRYADSVVQAMGDKQRGSAEDLLSHFVSADRRAQRVLRSALLEFRTEASGVLALLIESKLLVELGDELELISPLLIERWPFLQAALASQGEDKVLRERVAAAAREWDAQGRPDGALWHGEQADRLVAWFLATEARFGELELEFIGRVRNQGRRRRWLRRVGIGTAVFVMALVTVVALLGRRDLRAQLDAERASATKARTSLRAEIQARELRIAELELESDPLAALRAAHKSRALGENPKLDAIGWAARQRGVAVALPLHPGGAGGVRVSEDQRFVVTWGSEALHLLEIAGPKRERYALPHGLPPTALLLLGEGMIFGNVRGELWRAGPGAAPDSLAHCDGGVRRLARPEADTLRVLCSNQAQSAHSLVQISLGTKAAQQVWQWQGPAVELDPRGESVAGVQGNRVAGSVKEAKFELTLKDSAPLTALGWLGSKLVLGNERGELVLAQEQSGRWSAGDAVPAHRASVRKLVAAPDAEHLVSFGDDGRAVLFDAALHRIADFAVASSVTHFLEDFSAVTLEGPGHRLHVVSTSDGRPLGDFLGGGQPISAVASGKDWLFVASLDGATRAYPLHTTLPRRKQAQGRCSLGLDGGAVICGGERMVVVPQAGV